MSELAGNIIAGALIAALVAVEGPIVAQQIMAGLVADGIAEALPPDTRKRAKSACKAAGQAFADAAGAGLCAEIMGKGAWRKLTGADKLKE